MWLLLIVLITPFPQTVILERFAHKADCIKEADRVASEMQQAYPNSDDFKIVCRYKARIV